MRIGAKRTSIRAISCIHNSTHLNNVTFEDDDLCFDQSSSESIKTLKLLIIHGNINEIVSQTEQ